MLIQFFEDLIRIIIVMIILLIIKVTQPMLRFIIRADEVINLYKLFKDLPKKEDIDISYGRCKLKCANTNEACIELEKIVDDALKDYDELEQSDNADKCCEKYKDELIKISLELRELKNQKQEI